MGHIKEPANVDLVINSRPLTKKEETEISNYIQAYKEKAARKKTSTKRPSNASTIQARGQS